MACLLVLSVNATLSTRWTFPFLQAVPLASHLPAHTRTKNAQPGARESRELWQLSACLTVGNVLSNLRGDLLWESNAVTLRCLDGGGDGLPAGSRASWERYQARWH